MKKVWVVGYNTYPEWEIVGIFDSKEKAIDACTTPLHFVGPMQLNKRLPEDRVVWPDAEYPLKDKQPS